MARISVIVPARDVGGYVGPLLEDLRRQTARDLEIVVIDDGSTDDTNEVVERVMDEDDRIRLLTTEGLGSSVARNLGAEQTSGELLTFVDADDRLSPRYLGALLDTLEATGSDFACCNVRRLDGYRANVSVLHRRACAVSVRRTHVSRSPQLVWDTTIWNKLFRRDFWERAEVGFEPGRWINDLYPSLRAHALAGTVDVVGDALYFWRMRHDPGGSITERKFADPDARRKSLEDRLWALAQARELLTEHAGDGEALLHFDEKVLLHDLWTYLPFYLPADDSYRRLLVSRARAFLSRFGIDPDRFGLGPLLQRTYRAVLREDHDALARILHPSTRVVAAARRGRVTARLDFGGGRARPGQHLSQLVAATRALRSRNGAAPPRLEARLDRVELPPTGHGSVHGVVRMREGRSDLEGHWTAAIVLVGVRSGALVVGPRAAVEPPPDAGLHPLQRSGWRPFHARLDLPTLVVHTTEERWRVRVDLEFDGVTMAAETIVTAAAGRAFAMTVPAGDDADLVPVVTSKRGLQLRRERIDARLRGAAPQPAGRAVRLALAYAAGLTAGDLELWLQTPDGEQRTGRSPASEPLPLSPTGCKPARWELWSAAGDTPRRVRAHHDLGTTRLRLDTDDDGGLTETVLRPTVRGRVVVERRRPELELRWAEGGPGDRRALVVGGSGDPAEIGGRVHLELRCRWSDERVVVPLERHDDGWQARLPVRRLPGGDEDSPLSRGWSMHVVGSDGSDRPLRLPAEGRDALPLGDDALTPRTEIIAGPGNLPHVWSLADAPVHRWTTLRRLERATTSVHST